MRVAVVADGGGAYGWRSAVFLPDELVRWLSRLFREIHPGDIAFDGMGRRGVVP